MNYKETNFRITRKVIFGLLGCTVCIFRVKGASTSKVIGVRSEMMMDDYDGQMIFGDLVGLKLPDIRLTGEEKPRKNLTQETCPNRGSNPDPLRDKRACYHLLYSGGLNYCTRKFISKLLRKLIFEH